MSDFVKQFNITADDIEQMGAENEQLRELIRLASMEVYQWTTAGDDDHPEWAWELDCPDHNITPEQARLIQSCLDGGGGDE